MIRVVVVDDHATLRAAVVALLSEQQDIVVVGICDRGSSAIETVLCERPDVVLLDLRLGGLDGVEVTRRIIRTWPQARIVVYTAAASSHQAAAAVASGAVGVVVKSMQTDQLLDVIRDAVLKTTPQPPHRNPPAARRTR
jgi:DNA-binding NarL/FixJ family response regulator